MTKSGAGYGEADQTQDESPHQTQDTAGSGAIVLLDERCGLCRTS